MRLIPYRELQPAARIDHVGVTPDTLTGRGGLALFVRYLVAIGVLPRLERLFGSVRKNAKGATITNLFVPLICFFVDGSNRSLTTFDRLARDQGYAAGIHTPLSDMASSHTVKRFLKALWGPRVWLFRRLLQEMMIWRLRIEQPAVIELGIDTTALDNDDAQKRHGVQFTYKKIRGFQPLLLTCGPYVVDAILRGGKKHSNHGDTVRKMICRVVSLIRRRYRADVPIVLRSDSGFFDQKLFVAFEDLDIGYICTGKLYPDIKAVVAASWNEDVTSRYRRGDRSWRVLEFGDRRKAWKRFRRAFYTTPIKEGMQLVLPMSTDHDRVYYTNLGMSQGIDEALCAAGKEHWLDAGHIIGCIHGRGRDELVIRAMKDFASQKLPFKRFPPNAAWFSIMLLSFNLYEAFKRDVTAEIVAANCYPTTLRRSIIDIAAKIVRHAGQTKIAVTQATWDQLQMAQLWVAAGNPPAFPSLA